MATVQVNSWTEFLEAIAVSGDTVECPENAVWDMAQLEPEGHSGYIVCNAKINGRGTQIKNLVMLDSPANARFFFNDDVTDLHILNATLECSSSFFGVANFKTAQMCTFSGMLRGSGVGFGTNAYFYRCAANLEWATATGTSIFGRNCSVKYCNFKVSGTRLQTIALYQHNSSDQISGYENCYVILDTPQVTSLTGRKFKTSVLRCNAANVTDLSALNDGGGAQNFSLLVSSDFPNVQTTSSGVVLVTENNLRDAAYLQSIGFPIGVDG